MPLLETRITFIYPYDYYDYDDEREKGEAAVQKVRLRVGAAEEARRNQRVSKLQIQEVEGVNPKEKALEAWKKRKSLESNRLLQEVLKLLEREWRVEVSEYDMYPREGTMTVRVRHDGREERATVRVTDFITEEVAVEIPSVGKILLRFGFPGAIKAKCPICDEKIWAQISGLGLDALGSALEALDEHVKAEHGERG